MARAWTLISITEGRQYGGNLGYDDDPTTVYRYDSSVPNHLRLAKGDLVFVRDRDRVLGMARIEKIKVGTGVKTRLRCPVCNTPQIKERHEKAPRWRCVSGHVFESATEEQVQVATYDAQFDGHYVELNNALRVSELKSAATRPSDQLSIEEVDIRGIADRIGSAGTSARELLEHFLQATRPEIAGYEVPEQVHEAEYTLTLADARERINRSITLRRGQRRFRSKLIQRYGPYCMITRCALLEIVDAAHIWPYRGDDDNHPANGLLLRTDLHTLFDLDLLGIEPSTLAVRLHPSVSPAGYSQFHDAQLQVRRNFTPAAEALSRRWTSFQERLNQG
jgi:hypothetical protein